jgi:hypothetical protein
MVQSWYFLAAQLTGTRVRADDFLKQPMGPNGKKSSGRW